MAIEDPFWASLTQNLVITGGGLGIGAYVLKRWFVQNMAKDAAEKGALQIKDEVIAIREETIKHLRMEMRSRDGDWQERLDRKERDFLEFRQKTIREFEHVQKFNRATQSDIRKLNDRKSGDSIPQAELDTQILMTGLGPLDDG